MTNDKSTMETEHNNWKFAVGDVLIKPDRGSLVQGGIEVHSMTDPTEYQVSRRLWDEDDEIRLYYLQYEEGGKVQTYLASATMVERDWECVSRAE